jgi:hypothetical protein
MVGGLGVEELHSGSHEVRVLRRVIYVLQVGLKMKPTNENQEKCDEAEYIGDFCNRSLYIVKQRCRMCVFRLLESDIRVEYRGIFSNLTLYFEL